MSPRHVPASVTELARVGLLGALPGEVLAELAGEMHREQLTPGGTLEVGDGFAVVVSGMASAGGQVLRPGAHVGPGGELVVHAMTPATVALCEREAFERLVRPHLEA